MIIGIAQYKSVKGNINLNISRHLQMIHLAADEGAALLIFPELSITGYEPTLAKQLALDVTDDRFAPFREICESRRISLGIGAPIKQGKDECIGLVLFRPGQPEGLYSKKWLHEDELEFFAGGATQDRLEVDGREIALGICYEISVAEHRDGAMKTGAAFYIASVAKTAGGMHNASKILSEMAHSSGVTCMIANAIGYCDNFLAAGRSAIWSKEGRLLMELGEEEEALLLLNTDSGEILVKQAG